METSLFVFLVLMWWLAGTAMFLHVAWSILPKITVKDLMIASFAGLFGLLGVVFYIYYETEAGSILDIVVLQRKD